ncbi:outer membrane protein assembly factor BamB family protein [Streptomyces sp. NPDC005070]
MITGPIGTGKSSLLMLFKHALGGSAVLTPAVRENVLSVRAEVVAGDERVVLRRTIEGDAADTVDLLDPRSLTLERSLPVRRVPVIGTPFTLPSTSVLLGVERRMYEDRAPDSVWLPKRRLRALKPVWEARHSGRADSEVLGTWHCDGLIVRAAFDRLRAFDTATGEQRWAWEVPGRNVLSAMADEVVDGVALLIHWPDTSDGRKNATVTALDVTSGNQLWSARQNLEELRPGTSGLRLGTAALSGERAIIATGSAVVALDMHTGRSAWTVPHGLTNEAQIGAAGDRLLLVTRRAGTATVTSVDAADGTVRWEKPMPVDGPVARVRIVAADPVLLAVEGEGRRGPDCLLRLDTDGNAVAELSSDDDASIAPYASWALADGRRHVTWAGDTLVTFVRVPEYNYLVRLAGFSLSTGRHLWTWDGGWGIDALACHRGHVVVLRHYEDEHEGQHVAWRCQAYVLDPADGSEVARRRLRVTRDEPYTMHLHGNRMIWVNKESRPGTPPVKAFDWH